MGQGGGGREERPCRAKFVIRWVLYIEGTQTQLDHFTGSLEAETIERFSFSADMSDSDLCCFEWSLPPPHPRERGDVNVKVPLRKVEC